MAKKKSAKKTTPAKDFSNSPFKSLKGLSAFEEKKAETVSPPPIRQEQASSEKVAEEGSFADEMDFLGVTPLSGKTFADKELLPEVETKDPRANREASEQAVFLDALGNMEKVFKDEWQEEAPEKKATARRMKQVERGQLKPEAELDLHGLTVEEATSKVQFFLQSAVFQGFRTLRVITGKGLHSNDGPVLRQAIEKYLESQREQVAEWGTAPKRYGGEGALLVFLRGKIG